jgi:hypothetical protein
MDFRSRPEHRHQVRHQRAARRRTVHEPSRGNAGRDVLDGRLLRAIGAQLPYAVDAHRHQPGRHSGSIGAPLIADKTFFFATADYTRQDRTTFLSPTLPAFVLPPDGNLEYTGNYRQTLFNGRLDHKLTPAQTLMLRMNLDRFYDNNPQDAVGGTNAPSVARKYTRRSWTAQVNHTAVLAGALSTKHDSRT